YEPLGWELWAPVAPLFNAGRFAEAADRTRQLTDANPQVPMLRYLLACCEIRAGNTEEALEQLRAALVSSRMRMIAAKDPELDPIRADPAFVELMRSSAPRS